MSDQPTFEFDDDAPRGAGDDDAPRPANDAAVDTGEDTGDNHGDHKPFPSGAELRAAVCRAAWDAAKALKSMERAWDVWSATHVPGESTASANLKWLLAQLPTRNGEALQQFVSTGPDANGVEDAWYDVVTLTRSWSADPLVTPDTDVVASIDCRQSFNFAGPINCDSVWTTVSVDFDPDHSIDAFNNFFEALQAHGANFELELEEVTSFAVLQERAPSPEELLHLATARLQPDVSWQRDAIANPWPGFTASVEELVGGHGIILGEPFEAWCT